MRAQHFADQAHVGYLGDTSAEAIAYREKLLAQERARAHDVRLVSFVVES